MLCECRGAWCDFPALLAAWHHTVPAGQAFGGIELNISEATRRQAAQTLVNLAERTAQRARRSEAAQAADENDEGWVASGLFPTLPPIRPRVMREAAELYQLALELHPEGYWAYAQGLLLEEMRDFPAALAAYERARALGYLTPPSSLPFEHALEQATDPIARCRAKIEGRHDPGEAMRSYFQAQPKVGGALGEMLDLLQENIAQMLSGMQPEQGFDGEDDDEDGPGERPLAPQQEEALIAASERFAWHLIEQRFAQARAMLAGTLAAATPATALAEVFDELTVDAETPLDRVEVMPPHAPDATAPMDEVGSVYVAIGSDEVDEGMYLTWVDEDGELRIGHIEWGRP